ncbi:MAG: NADPH:quinone oxidoreductase family protein, partial [Acidobacteria bacterium]|nr:NADPH:quinone oxidoreductase family protein [Acidobacteriota bacterium]
YQVKTRLPFTPGGECAGTVIEVGSAVEADLSMGDRVMVLGGPGLNELVNVAPSSTWKIPDELSFEKAAAIPVNYGTTWFALHERAQLAVGEKLLVLGAAGGTGSSAIQLGKAAGAEVIAVAGGAEKCAMAKKAGADHVIDHHETPQFVDVVREMSGGGVDVAYDPVGGDTTHQIRRCMAWDGRLLIIGFVAGIPDLPANHALLKNYSIVGVHWGASLARNPDSVDQQMHSVLDLVPSGAVDPLIYPPYTFDDGAQALQDLADRKTWGKAVVTGSSLTNY